MPPQTSSINVRIGIPIGVSTSPTCFSGPCTVIILVPALVDVPIWENHSPPLLMMDGTLAKVSVLLRTVGRRQRPSSTERGGLVRGWPRTPMTEYISAEPSPQM